MMSAAPLEEHKHTIMVRIGLPSPEEALWERKPAVERRLCNFRVGETGRCWERHSTVQTQ